MYSYNEQSLQQLYDQLKSELQSELNDRTDDDKERELVIKRCAILNKIMSGVLNYKKLLRE